MESCFGRLVCGLYRVKVISMEIGILSDTHISPNMNFSDLYDQLTKAFSEVELILHAGDVTNVQFITALEQIAPVEGVIGNLDDNSIHERFSPFVKIEIEQKKIGIMHQMPVYSFVTQEMLDILVTGHTHVPIIKEYFEQNHGFLHLNPGSPTQPRAPPLNTRYKVQRKALATVIVLELTQDISSAYIVTLR